LVSSFLSFARALKTEFDFHHRSNARGEIHFEGETNRLGGRELPSVRDWQDGREIVLNVGHEKKNVKRCRVFFALPARDGKHGSTTTRKKEETMMDAFSPRGYRRPVRFLLSFVCLWMLGMIVVPCRGGNELLGVRDAADWAKRRRQILVNVQRVMGPLPDERHKVPLDVRVTETVELPTHVRKKLSFAAEKDDRVPAYLLLPKKRRGKRAAVLVLHQTVAIGKDEPAGLGKKENLRIGVHLVERGYVVLCPDYPSFGEYRYDFKKSKYQSGSMKAVWNNVRAVDLLTSLPQVDGERIGCIGHSLGGHNAMFTALFDARIKVCVSNCGFTRFAKYYGGNLKGWTSDRYVPLIASKYEMKPEKVPFDFPQIVAALAPRAFLASAPLHDDNFDVSGVRDCMTAARPIYELLNAKEKLAANYPDCKHDFPPEARKVAYEWLDRWLK
jgi:dienelactone hydrolase